MGHQQCAIVVIEFLRNTVIEKKPLAPNLGTKKYPMKPSRESY